jgi:hypothetical protein
MEMYESCYICRSKIRRWINKILGIPTITVPTLSEKWVEYEMKIRRNEMVKVIELLNEKENK